MKGLGAFTVNHPGVRKRNRGGETGKRKRGQKNSRPGERDWCLRDGGGPMGKGMIIALREYCGQRDLV